MGNKKHREALINRIRKIDDENVLDEVKRLLDLNFDDTFYQLNEDQEAEITQAMEELSRGEGISSNQVEKDFYEWLNK